jgi:hypothetical protein
MPLQIRRGPTADRLAITPLVGEIVYDTTTGAVFVGNGVTAGGVPVTAFSVADSKNATVELFLGLSHSDNTQHSGITFQNIGGRIQATVAQDLSNYQGLIVADQGFRGSLWADDSGIIINSETHTVYGNFVAQGSILPDTNIAYDIGSSTKRFRDLYLSGSSIYLGNSVLTSTGTAIDLPLGTTVAGSPIGFDENATYGITISGNVIGTDSTVLVNTTNGTFRGDLTGSVFADDSTILVDGRDGVLRGELVGTVTGDVTGSLIGNAASSSVASTVALTATNTSINPHYISFVAAATGNENVRTDTNLFYVPSSNTLTASTFVGNLTGNVTGSVTGNVFTTLIDSADSSAITVTPAVIFSSDVTVENELFVRGDFSPVTSESYNLGSYTKKFNKLYLTEGNNALWIGNAAISGNGTAINLPAGSTVGGSAITTAAGSNATTITVNTTGTSADYFVSFFDDQTGDNLIYTDDTFKYNPGTGYLTVGNATIGTVYGNVQGNLTGSVNGNVTGDLTGNVLGNTVGYHNGDVKGSVFGDDSAAIVDSVSGVVTAILVGGSGSSINGGGLIALGGTAGVTGQLTITSNAGASQQRLSMFSNTATDTNRISFERGRGTLASPASVLTGDRLSDIRFNGYSTDLSLVTAAMIRAEVGNTVSAGVVPGLLRFQTANSSGVLTNAGSIDSTQTWRISGGLYSFSGTGGIGYSTGAGGTVTQGTSKSTGVTLNKVSGQITTHNEALNSNTSVSFTFTNSAIVATDVIYACISSGATAGSYVISVDAVGSGSCQISIRNITGSALAEALVLNFVIIKSVTA